MPASCSADVFVTEGLQCITLRSRAFAPAEVDRPKRPAGVGGAGRRSEAIPQIVGFESSAGKVSLTDAGIIVSGGRGVGGPEGFAPIRSWPTCWAGRMGASRAAVDAGWIPYEHQVGQTGKTVSPDLYIACGISGAIQHQAGMRTAKVIVAKDQQATDRPEATDL
jgi:electron transfer flavoprotein alpha subunit